MKSVQVHLTKAPDKAATGIVGFDSITGGGLPRWRITLLVGGSGFDEDEALFVIGNRGLKLGARPPEVRAA